MAAACCETNGEKGLLLLVLPCDLGWFTRPAAAPRRCGRWPPLQIKQEGELRGHSDGVTNVAWHPSHADKLASIAGAEKSVR